MTQDTPATPPEKRSPPQRLIVGRVVRPWGRRGQVKIEPLSDFPHRFRPGLRLFVGGHALVCEGVTRPPRTLVLKLQGVETPEEAEELRGALVEVLTTETEPLPEGAYYHYQILGLEVYTTGGDYLGHVTQILSTGGNDAYVVQGPRGEAVIPATAEVVTSLDLGTGRMTIEPMPGLL